MSNKELQFELWQECNSKCKFCYLCDEILYTAPERKIDTMKQVYDIISDMNNYPEYDTISYLGGEFFQGQLNTPEVKEMFFKLIDKTVWLLNNEYIKEVWVYATMTIGDQEDLYQMLEKFKGHKGKLWILTSYDTMGRFHTQKMEDTWKYHIMNIHKLYPDILFNATSILTGDLIEKYLDGRFSFKKMMEDYGISFFMKQPCLREIYKDKKEMNEALPNFFPTRDMYLKFLKKFKEEEDSVMWSKLFNINYRADVLYRYKEYRCKDTGLLEKAVRSKDGSYMETHEDHDFMLPCGHLNKYACYIDNESCCLCDKLVMDECLK